MVYVVDDESALAVVELIEDSDLKPDTELLLVVVMAWLNRKM